MQLVAVPQSKNQKHKLFEEHDSGGEFKEPDPTADGSNDKPSKGMTSSMVVSLQNGNDCG
jgi:hypothetical protein